MKTVIVLVAGAVLPLLANAQACTAKSPAHTLALIELYTSEGCSSCPPADQFLSERAKSGVTDKQAVPLSLHVDYWNYIGWKDPFSSQVFTERQRWLSDLAHTRTIYTPEFFVGGHELRDWSGGVAASVRKVNAKPAQANISIARMPVAAGMLPVQVQAQGPAGANLYVTLVQDGVESQVKAGENKGKTLRHSAVVRHWAEPVRLGADGKASFSHGLPVPANANPASLGVTAFVQSEQGEVLQAFSLNQCAP